MFMAIASRDDNDDKGEKEQDRDDDDDVDEIEDDVDENDDGLTMRKRKRTTTRKACDDNKCLFMNFPCRLVVDIFVSVWVGPFYVFRMIASSPGNARFTFTFLRCFVITLRKLPETKDTYFAGIHLDGVAPCPQTSLSAKEETTSVSLRKRPAASAEQNQKQDVDNEAHVEAMQISQPHVNPLFKVFARHHRP